MLRRLIELSVPRSADAPPIVLHILSRAGWPEVLVPPLADAIDLYWLMPPVVEGPAPMPTRDFTNTARIFCTTTSVGRS
jgi:hypothetical protein